MESDGPPGRASSGAGPAGTLVESVDEIRRVIQGSTPPVVSGGSGPPRAQVRRAPPPSSDAPPPLNKTPRPVNRAAAAVGLNSGGPANEPAAAAIPQDAATPYRPLHRPPTILVCVLDDGSTTEGEWFRLRSSSLTVGRTQGDILLPQDSMVSSQHLEITLRQTDGRYRVALRDLESRNGSFVRAARVTLRDGQEMLIGGRRYVFSAGGAAGVDANTDGADSGATRGWHAGSAADLAKLLPALQEVVADEAAEAPRYPLHNDEQFIGSDPQVCAIVLPEDPFISRVHARIQRDNRGRWVIENQKSLNGLWFKFSDIAIDATGEVQVGEQRLLIKIP